MKRLVYIPYDTGTAIFFPAPPGQREPDAESLFEDLRENNSKRIFSIDNDKLVNRYVYANNQEYKLFEELLKHLVKEDTNEAG